MSRTPLLAGLAALLSAPCSPAQWSVLDGAPDGPLWVADAALVHDDGEALRGRAVPGSEWIELAPSGAVLLGLSDHLALIDGPAGPTVWDARQGSLTPLTFDGVVFDARVEDELAFVVTVDGGTSTGHAWSARTGGWSTRVLGAFVPDPFAVVSGDGVAAVRTPTGYLGFGAASGLWGELAAEPLGDYPEAAGHVAGVRLFDPATQQGVDRYAAFSGHRGTWTVSNELHYSSIPRFARDSIAVRLETPVTQRYRPAIFDGYRGQYLTGPMLHTDGTPLDVTGAHLHVLDDVIADEPYIEWFTLLGPQGNGFLAGAVELLVADDDLIVLADQDAGSVVGVSSFAGDAPVERLLTGAPVPLGTGRGLALIGDDAGSVHAFLARLGQWAEPLALALPVLAAPEVALGDVGALVAVDGELHGLSATGLEWVTLGQGPAVELWAGPGILAARTADRLWLFDARHGQWLDGGAWVPGTQLSLGDDHLVVFDPEVGELRAWSAAAPGWQVADGPSLPLAAAPQSQGRLTRVFDATGRLWSFGAGAGVEAAGRWPSELDPVLRPEFVGGAARLDATLAGRAGELGLLLIDLASNPGGPSLPPIGGTLELGPAPFVASGPVDLGPSGTARTSVALPEGLPSGLTLWLQGFLIDAESAALRFGPGASRAELP